MDIENVHFQYPLSVRGDTSKMLFFCQDMTKYWQGEYTKLIGMGELIAVTTLVSPNVYTSSDVATQSSPFYLMTKNPDDVVIDTDVISDETAVPNVAVPNVAEIGKIKTVLWRSERTLKSEQNILTYRKFKKTQHIPSVLSECERISLLQYPPGYVPSTIKNMGIIRSVFDTDRYNLNRYMGKRWFGQSFEPSHKMMLLVAGMWITMSIPCILALWLFIPWYYIFLIAFQIPFHVYIISLINIDLAKRVLIMQETIIYTIWVVVFAVSIIVQFSESENFVGYLFFMALCTLDMLLIPFFDTLPHDQRVVVNIIVLPAAIVLMILWEIALFFNWSCTPNYSLTFGQTKYSASGISSTSLYNVIALITINIFYMIRHPNRLTMIVGMTEVLTLHEEESDLIRTMYQVERQISKRNQLQLPFMKKKVGTIAG